MKKLLIVILILAFFFSISGCATIFYPDRIGTAPGDASRIDVLMLVLDIIFGVWPLVIDLVSGALWIPYAAGPQGYYINSETGEIRHFEAIEGEIAPGNTVKVQSVPVGE